MPDLHSILLAGGSALGCATVLFGAGVAPMVRPSSTFFGRVHWRGDASVCGPRYALTFDDGPTEPSTARILDVLGELDVRATFFVVGRNVQRWPRLVERIHAEGHLVANHSLDHPHYGLLRGQRYWRHQIRATDALVERIIGVRPAMFRPPMGVKQWFICGEARRLGHEVVTWSRRGYDGIRTDARQILDRLVPHTTAGDVLLLHDGIDPNVTRDPSASVAVVRPLVEALRARGLEPAPLDQLLRLPAYARGRCAASRIPRGPRLARPSVAESVG